jgi:hypothetical protein
MMSRWHGRSAGRVRSKRLVGSPGNAPNTGVHIKRQRADVSRAVPELDAPTADADRTRVM